MSIRERLHAIPDLILSKQLLLMTDFQVNEYVKSLHIFIEDFPTKEAELKTEMEAGDIDSVIKSLSGIREMLVNIRADELANECWKYLNSFDKDRPERMEAYVSFFLAMLTSLSIDIQMALFKIGEDDGDKTSSGSAGEEGAVKTILAVDDSVYFLDTFKAALKDVECRIIGATSASSALQMLKRFKPDLFVLDIDMPKMDGIELANELRNLGQSAPIVFITGNATKEYVLKCMQAGASDFIVKPINPEGVVSRIKKFL